MRATTIFTCVLIVLSHVPGLSQPEIKDISPTVDNTTLKISGLSQSVSGKALCIATSKDGKRVYLGGHSGVWRSDDGGETWRHLQRPQPPADQFDVPGALWVPNVYDLLVSPVNKNIVLAATGNDARVPAQSGIYRSTDGGSNWDLVHQFTRTINGQLSVGNVGCFAVAPDNSNLIYAAGTFAVAMSTDGGITWSETIPQSVITHRATHVVTGPQQGTKRHVFAVGSRVWFSQDGGATWSQDPKLLSLGFPQDGPGPSSRALAIHPTNPNVIYLMNGQQQLWRGDFSSFDANAGASWTLLPSVPIGYPGTTASGGDYVMAHVTPEDVLYLIVSDRRTVHITTGDPNQSSNWGRMDGGNIHVDPHGIALTSDFGLPVVDGPSPSSFGRIFMVNDGGIDFSTTGTATWHHGKGLTTLGLVNAAVLSSPGKEPAFCIGTGDNSGFFSPDGGQSWITQDYLGGDNDCTFADPRQPSRLLVFAPRSGNREIFLYTDPGGGYPDGAFGTSQRKNIPGPPPLPGETKAGWNAVSNFFGLGYRPLILTPKGETPRPDGDFVTIRFLGSTAQLLRTTKMSQISSPNDWVTSATTESSGAKVFRQGPNLPDVGVNVVQASGGHDSPVYYVGDPGSQKRLWKWTSGMSAWQPIVPGPLVSGQPVPAIADRFYIDPYRPNTIYVLDVNHIWRSANGGTTWVVDASLEAELTENNAFPFKINVPNNTEPGASLLRDMQFDPNKPGYRFAIGTAGVFYTLDGNNWDHLLRTSAMPMRPNNAFYVPDPCNRALYVATNNRGLLRIQPLPPDWKHPVGSVVVAVGKITLLRVHDKGTKYGPPQDQLDAEVIIWLDTEPDKAFGLKLRRDSNEESGRGMLDQLRHAFNTETSVRIDYVRSGCRTGRIIRVMNIKGKQVSSK